MRYLPLLSRLAFICNLAFLAAVLLRFQSMTINQNALSIIVIAGFFLAVYVCSPLVVLGYAVVILRRKVLFAIVPRWLVLVNCIFFAAQIIYLIIQ